ncbi:phasin family protein [Marinobacter sp. M3C]|uniref:phasin family protein n=1 Tax=unclassified Marinobacter TaxID=83889 RepID=UPI0020105DE5|nr:MULTISPECIES: phasin family protein [unclassified Marinobacter]MCL1482912.1 phasin family protein [Marinobacter sp.]MCL1488732.1 phasin family protein [Marinobacter sp.]UQG54072.1 phasin family protein [Marinobacter sp. M4C]UQG60520.1 phasin family protein [Marinobacter sp. M3C]UQG62879.1 phasin family protein [Marinobacter sp. M2C]
MTDEHDKDTDADAQLPDKIKDSDAQLPGRIKDSARQIWLAGLGAFNKAEEDTGRFFERLVQEGEQMENRTRGVVEKQLKSVEDRVEGVRERATGTWDKLEHLFDQRVSGALRRLGMYRQEDVMTLEKRVERLEAELDRLKKLTPGYNEEE